MNYYIKTKSKKEILDEKTGQMISIFIIKKIIEDNQNFCVLEKIYSNINNYSKKNNFFFYKNDKKRNLNTYIKKKHKSIYKFIEKNNKFFILENNFVKIKN
tara:strand:+ start:570 stop:872 length:303 start_codon:yes stop_codon:yes gene_type:complete